MIELLLVAVIFTCGCNREPDSPKASITVFAASSLTDVLQELIRQFEIQEPGIEVHMHVGATSLLAKQIQQGAPADLFMAASPNWIEYLESYDLIVGSAIPLAGNTLAILGSPGTSPIDNLSELGKLNFLAMADPSHVPAGIYGKQALQCAGVWDTIAPQILPTLNARAVLAAVASGGAEVGMVYGSDTNLIPELKLILKVPDSCAPEIRYTMSLIRDNSNPEVAEAFLTFTVNSLQSNLWEKFGFTYQ